MTKLTPRSRAAAQVAALLSGCLLMWACPAAAFTPSVPKTKTGGENTPLSLGPSTSSSHTSSGGASIVRTIVGLAIVIAVIWGLAWILRQVKTGRGDARVGAVGLTSVAALTLGSGRTVHLVRAGSDYILLGSGEHGVAPIHRYTEQQAREAGLLPAEEPSEYPRPRLLGPGRTPERRPPRQLGAPSSSGDPRPSNNYDPMHMPSPSANVVERLREWTVRR
jgi:flagellar protein FliO/FliZ